MNTIATIGGVIAPDSGLSRKAAALAERVHSRVMLNHVHRTWWFAELLGRKRGLSYDREAVYLASLLHDLGLTEDFMADQRFEVDGADAASRFLRANGYADARAQLVWDAIALHSSAGIADRREPEVALVNLGAHIDVMGLNLDELAPSLVDDVLQLYPRLGFKAAFQEALAEVVRKKPHTAIGTGLADIGRRHVHDCAIPDVCDLLDHAPFES
ncbi:HD domain-containing protein [Cupriavidus pauculus]|uniref:HD domain-containing protein n=1 Tax=Cupriavidus pauculus TaxID=82633 RepID=A0A5P2H2R9_9BURK|nr:HD domain-containing protein [Cupriavidus pauculus]QET01620.1 HD domain-containing protein [Cupriavidus pauculus]